MDATTERDRFARAVDWDLDAPSAAPRTLDALIASVRDAARAGLVEYRSAGLAGRTAPACIVCGAPVHAERIAASPRARTCSRECSREHGRALRRAGAARRYAAERAARGAADGPGEHAAGAPDRIDRPNSR